MLIECRSILGYKHKPSSRSSANIVILGLGEANEAKSGLLPKVSNRS